MKNNIYRRFVKRGLDILLSMIALVLLSPIILLTIVLVRIKLGSPIMFNQKRPGLNEKIFVLYKFRTMTNQKDESGKLLPDEIRLTRFGKFLRSSSLDELPQLINIVKGDMSIVGPRPLLITYLPLYNKMQRIRHNVRPGLVGLAGVRGRNNQNWDDKFRNDIEYVNNISFKLDCQILFKAIYVVLNRKGVNQIGEATAAPFLGNEEKDYEHKATL